MSDNNTILNTLQNRLRILKEQKAKFGSHFCPPHIILEIQELERQIAQHISNAYVSALPNQPNPCFVHPYPLPSSFTGRVNERKLLTMWLSHGTETIMALIAIGGMGKSILSWAWVQRDILGHALPTAVDDSLANSNTCRVPETLQPEGILWWSFYEAQANFTAFLNEAISYASGRQLNPTEVTATYDKVRTLLSLLEQHRILLVLDGFERELRAYNGLNAAYQDDVLSLSTQDEFRTCTDTHAARFLRDASTIPLKSRILLTSRLFPRELDDLAGCRRVNLASLAPEDAVSFFQAQGIRGTRTEIEAVCTPYGYHALALRLLAGIIKKHKRNPNDIRVACNYSVLPELKGKAQHHILQTAYNALEVTVQGYFRALDSKAA